MYCERYTPHRRFTPAERLQPGSRVSGSERRRDESQPARYYTIDVTGRCILRREYRLRSASNMSNIEPSYRESSIRSYRLISISPPRARGAGPAEAPPEPEDCTLGVSAQKVEVFKKGSRADFLHYTASIVMVDHGSTRITPRR